MLSGHLLAEDPTFSGHDLRGRGNPNRNTGSVNRGSSGAAKPAAIQMTARFSGRRIRLTAISPADDVLLCFLILHEVTNVVQKKYSLFKRVIKYTVVL